MQYSFGLRTALRMPIAAVICAALSGGLIGPGEAPPPMPAPAKPAELAVKAPLAPIVAALETVVVHDHKAVSAMLAKRYLVAQDVVAGFVETAYRIGTQTKIDPLLLLAVISIESKFNPVAESPFGARGLMQIIPKFHMEKLTAHGGEGALLDPDVNILVGAQILREYLRRFGGIEDALQAYVGAYGEPTAEYAAKVLSEKARLEQLVTRRSQPV